MTVERDLRGARGAMMDDYDLSKRLTRYLRHKGRDLRMRADGFVEILLLCRALRTHQQEIEDAVDMNNRFEIARNPGGTWIRAVNKHSRESGVDPELLRLSPDMCFQRNPPAARGALGGYGRYDPPPVDEPAEEPRFPPAEPQVGQARAPAPRSSERPAANDRGLNCPWAGHRPDPTEQRQNVTSDPIPPRMDKGAVPAAGNVPLRSGAGSSSSSNPASTTSATSAADGSHDQGPPKQSDDEIFDTLAHLDELERKNEILETEKRVLKKDRNVLLSENNDLKRQIDDLKTQTEHLQQKLRWYEEQCNCQASGNGPLR